MTQHNVERAVVTGAEAVGSALEMFERRLIDRFNGLLEAERVQWLDVRDMVAAVATELAETRRVTDEHRGELMAALSGLSVDIGILSAGQATQEERTAARAQLADHERRIAALEARYGNGD